MVHNSPTTRALDHPIDLPHCPCSLLRMALASFPLSFVLGQKGKGNKQDWLGQFGHFVWEGSLKGNSWCLAFWNRVVIKEGIVSGSWGYGQPSLFLSLFFSFFHPLICTFTIQRSFMGNSVFCIPFLHMQKTATRWPEWEILWLFCSWNIKAVFSIGEETRRNNVRQRTQFPKN